MSKKIILTTVLLFLLTLISSAQILKKDTSTNLPDIDVYDVNGVHTTLHQLAKNKVLVIDCWFIPCGPCFLALGPLHRISARYAGNKDVCFITICMTDSGQVKEFLRQDTAMNTYVRSYQWLSHETRFTLPVYFMPGCRSTVKLSSNTLHADMNDQTNCPSDVFNFSGYPTCMVYTKQGRQVYKNNAFDTEEKYTQRLTSAINKALANSN